jgi:hypothetical protein
MNVIRRAAIVLPAVGQKLPSDTPFCFDDRAQVASIVP